MYNRRHCYPYESISSAWQKPEKCNSTRFNLAPPHHSVFLRAHVFFSVYQIIKTPQEFEHYSSWLERAVWWGNTLLYPKGSHLEHQITLPQILRSHDYFITTCNDETIPRVLCSFSLVASGSISTEVKC